MRLRPLSEAECYARCYGGRGEERVSFVRTVKRAPVRASSGERLRELFEQRLAARAHEQEAA